MTVIICAIMASVVYMNQRAIFGANLTERTLLGGAHLRVLLIGELDAPGLGNHAKIQSALNALREFGYRSSSGQFVLLRVMDGSYTPVASVNDNTFPHLKTVEELLSTRSYRFAPGERDLWHEVVTIDGKPCIHIAFPLANSRNEIVAYAEGVFAVSDSAVAQLHRAMLRAVLYAVLIVIATVALLYPVIVRLMKRIATLSVNLLEANLETINVLGSAIAKRDSDTDLHNYRVTIYSVCLAEKLGLAESDIRSLIKGAFLHDVGKIGIRDNVLLKPGRLDDEEFREMKQHVQHGKDIVSRAVWLQDALNVVCWHHEKYDGSGYDLQKKGDEIPIGARLFAIIDVFDALTSHRPYKEPLTFERTMEILEEGKGTHFDPSVLDAFHGMARDLYDRFANSDEATLKAGLESIAMRYFTGDIGEMLKG
ncbi:MAG: HD-GYP domain-containing protein [Desulfuromonadales bacterium]|nr:MAG: HD-GYP domain-containing protein [Desulfuromonadales bacterium]